LCGNSDGTQSAESPSRAGRGTLIRDEEKWMSDRVVPFLMFGGRAEEAMRFYVSLFPEARVVEIARYGKGAAAAEGAISRATFSIGGQTFLCTDSAAANEIPFTPAISLFVQCHSTRRMRNLVERLAEGGKVLMPLDNYGFSKLFAWVADKFGVSWQLSLG
jgi:predicted 3-demethylubiquinone-9 3-methyltransferase (glyoxalase superfamily)